MKKLIALGVVAATVGVWQWRSGGDEAPPAAVTDGSKIALDRLWIDKFPQSEREVFNLFVAIDDDEIGIHQATSVWTGKFELFKFQSRGGALQVLYPQTGEKETVKLRARECDEGEFDFCLEMAGSSRGVKRYYSKAEWVIDRAASGPALAAQVQSLLEAK